MKSQPLNQPPARNQLCEPLVAAGLFGALAHALKEGPATRIPKPKSRILNPESRHPNPETWIPKPESRITKSETRNPRGSGVLISGGTAEVAACALVRFAASNPDYAIRVRSPPPLISSGRVCMINTRAQQNYHTSGTNWSNRWIYRVLRSREACSSRVVPRRWPHAPWCASPPPTPTTPSEYALPLL